MDNLNSLHDDLFKKRLQHRNKKAMYGLFSNRESEESNRIESQEIFKEIFKEILEIQEKIRLLTEI